MRVRALTRALMAALLLLFVLPAGFADKNVNTTPSTGEAEDYDYDFDLGSLLTDWYDYDYDGEGEGDYAPLGEDYEVSERVSLFFF